MATYAIGDVHGCLDELKQLLDTIHYDPTHDALWFVGDLVNRGPYSLETLRYIKQLDAASAGENRLTLGNHDLFLLSIYAGYSGYGSQKHGMHDILAATDVDELMQWLRHASLAIVDHARKTIVAHAGVPPDWQVEDCVHYAKAVENRLQGADWQQYLSEDMIGNHPKRWQADLPELDALRYSVNALTRMRFCQADGALDFKEKAGIKRATTVEQSSECTEKDKTAPPESEAISTVQPWFAMPSKLPKDWTVVFGHWSALEGDNQGYDHIKAIDGGCLWGGELIALDIDNYQTFKVRGKPYRNIKT